MFRRSHAKRRPVNSPVARFARLLMVALALTFAAFQPVAAADEGSVLRDSETELLFKQMSKPLIEAAGLDPNSVQVVLLKDDEINAFVERGQTVYLQSGLIEAADNVESGSGRGRARDWPHRRRRRDPQPTPA